MFLKLTHVRNELAMFGSTKTDVCVMKMGEPAVVCFDGIVMKSARAGALVEIANTKQARAPTRRMLETSSEVGRWGGVLLYDLSVLLPCFAPRRPPSRRELRVLPGQAAGGAKAAYEPKFPSAPGSRSPRCCP